MRVVIDGVCFQRDLAHGIARLWRSVLEEWVASGFIQHVLLLDRGGTAPPLPGVRRRVTALHAYERLAEDRAMLQRVCDEDGADAFMSTYYSAPATTATVMMVYDMIPEVMKADIDRPVWREKAACIANARRFVAISRSTANDLLAYYPDIAPERVSIALPAVAPAFRPAAAEELDRFTLAYGIRKPYYLLVGRRANWYKNSDAFFRAYSTLADRQRFGIVCVGGNEALSADQQGLCAGSDVHLLRLTDDDLRRAYSGAIALVYPSLYEGFGLPVVEALASGCPVITTPIASLPEAAGDAALYVSPTDTDALARALLTIQQPDLRASLIARGLERARLFSWTRMAHLVSQAIESAADGQAR